MDIPLMTDVHNESVVRRLEDPVQCNRQFDHTEIWSQMPSGLRKDSNQLFTYLLCELGQVLFAERLDIGGRSNPVEQARWRRSRLGSPSRLRRA